MKTSIDVKSFILGALITGFLIFISGYASPKKPIERPLPRLSLSQAKWDSCAVAVDDKYCYIAGIAPANRLRILKIAKVSISEHAK